MKKRKKAARALLPGTRVIGTSPRRRTAAGAVLLVLCMGLLPMQAAAASPEFAYSEEKWASLQDNRLEFDEIAELVHEYNTTVIKNNLEYLDYKGKTSSNISKDYYDSAEDILDNIQYPEDDSANYAGQLSSALNNQQQAETLVEQGDNNVDDGDIKKLGYQQQEAQLVKQAQGLMISYWSQTYSLSTLEDRVSQAETSYQSVLNKKQAGTATQSQVEAAAESITTAKGALLSAQKSLEKTKEQLCLMLGWSYGADVEICELPEPDTEAIAAIDVNADVKKALENNYSVKISERRIANAQSATVRETQQKTYDNQMQTASTSVKNAYNNLILAKADYEQANESCALEKNSLAAAKTRLAAGTITRNTYDQQESSCLSAEVSVMTQRLNLLQSMLDYEWAVNGLASVS